MDTKPTLRDILPLIKNDSVEVVIEDVFDVSHGGECKDGDRYKIIANSGSYMVDKLKRSRVVEGESILDLTPTAIRQVAPPPTLVDGSLDQRSDGYIQVWVRPPVPDEED